MLYFVNSTKYHLYKGFSHIYTFIVKNQPLICYRTLYFKLAAVLVPWTEWSFLPLLPALYDILGIVILLTLGALVIITHHCYIA